MLLLLLIALFGFSFGGVASATNTAQAGPAAASRASLRVVSTRPLVLRAKGFSARERVRVTATATGASRSKRMRASATGTFVVSFDSLSYDRCQSGLLVTATGTRHSATLKLPPAECPIP